MKSKKKCCSVRNEPPSKNITITNFFALILFILYPKCPGCWAAYASLFSSMGIGKIDYSSNWKYIAAAIFLASTVYLIRRFILSREWLSLKLYSLGLLIYSFGYFLEWDNKWWLWCGSFLFLLSISCRNKRHEPEDSSQAKKSELRYFNSQ